MSSPEPSAGTSEVDQIDDLDFDAWLGNVLRFGVLAAAAVVLFGGVLYLVRDGGRLPAYHEFHGEPMALRSIRGIVSDARTMNGPGVIQLGLLLLIATPVARVVFSVFGFVGQHDWMYVGITLVVLILLIYSLTGK